MGNNEKNKQEAGYAQAQEHEIVQDELGPNKSTYIKKVLDFVQTISRTDISTHPERALLIVALDSAETSSKGQALMVGGGTREMLYEAAEALINHPQLGSLIMMVAAERMIIEKFPADTTIPTENKPN